MTRAGPARSVVLSAIAGAAMPLAFAPFGWWWLAPVCYAVLFLAWRGLEARAAFLAGLAFGAAEFLLGTYWIYISVHGFGQAPIWLAGILLIGLVAAMALYPAAVGWVAARWLGTVGAGVWLGALPALFVLAEWLRGFLLTGFGWLSPGYSQTDSWLLGFAPLLGELGVGWAVLLVAGALATGLVGRQRERLAAAAVALVLFGTGFVADRVAWTSPRDGRISVALAQGAVPQDKKWLPEELPDIKELYRRLTNEALGSRLIVWPEAAIPDLYENQQSFLDATEALAARSGSRLMLGMLKYDFDTGGYQNAVFVLGQPGSVYIKRHLVPYGEYFPVPGFVREWLRAMNLPNIDTERGAPGQRPLEVLGERIAVTICYEDVFGAEQLPSFPEATLLVNVSNDAWFGDSIAADQHLQIARMRAAEVRRFELRSTNTGVTAVIGPRGEVISRLPQFEPGVLRANVQGMAGGTPYIVWGNWSVVLLALAVLAVYGASTKLTMRPGT